MVLTSAFHFIVWGHPHNDHVFTQADWTILNGPGVNASDRSKTFRRRRGLGIYRKEGRGIELTTMLPVTVMGPVMRKDISGTNHVIQRLLSGGGPQHGRPQVDCPVQVLRF